MKWFGSKPFGGMCDTNQHVDTPVGEPCLYCEEPIQAGDLGVIMAVCGSVVFTLRPQHRECLLRGVLGSVAHIQEQCSCFVEGSTLGDPDGMTKRQAAQASVVAWNRKQHGFEQY